MRFVRVCSLIATPPSLCSTHFLFSVPRIPPTMVPDHQIHALCAIVDTDFSGTVDIEETRFPKRGVDVDE